MPAQLTVVGSVNLDLVARVERFPRAGETLTALSFERIPGGKGANQAVAAARLGARGSLRRLRRPRRRGGGGARQPARRSTSTFARGMRRRARADRRRRRRREPDRRRPRGERRGRRASVSGSVLCQLEIPDERDRAGARERGLAVRQRGARTPVRRRGRPRRREPLRARGDRAAARARRADAGRRRRRAPRGREGGRARVGAEGRGGRRDGGRRRVHGGARRLAARGARAGEALRRACAAGAIAAPRFGAQPSLPTADEVDAILAADADADPPRLRPGPRRRDRAPARARVARAGAARRDHRRGQPDAAEDDRERDPRARLAGRGDVPGRRRRGPRRSCASCHVAAHVHGETGLDGPDLPPPSREPLAQHAVDFLAEQIRARDGARHARADRAADERRAAPRAAPRRAGPSGSCSWAARSATAT